MNCTCGGWQYWTIEELDGRERVVRKCSACKKVMAEAEEEEEQ